MIRAVSFFAAHELKSFEIGFFVVFVIVECWELQLE